MNYTIAPLANASGKLITMENLPEPHPLDYDWRFTQDTVLALDLSLPRTGRVLAVGAPSVARFMEARGRGVLLVDRQPVQGVRAHLVRDLALAQPPCGRFAVAVIDPPWYPEDVWYWACWTAKAVGPGRSIFVSIWPDSTRPRAKCEKSRLIERLSTWAKPELVPCDLHYTRPLFEQMAVSASVDPATAASPGFGDLLHLQVKRVPDLPARRRSTTWWHRFVINDYQLAVRVDASDGTQLAIRAHPHSKGWIWPHVSRRAPHVDQIGLWSSRNEVALLKGSGAMLQLIRRAIGSTKFNANKSELNRVPQLASWSIPRPPYDEVMEWTHRKSS